MDALSAVRFGFGKKNPVPGSGAWNQTHYRDQKPGHEVQIPLYDTVDSFEIDRSHHKPSSKPEKGLHF